MVFVAEPVAAPAFTASAKVVSPVLVMVNLPAVGPASLAFGMLATMLTVESVVAEKFAPEKLGATVMLLLNNSEKL